MSDQAAKAVETILRGLPKSKEYEYRKSLVPQAATELDSAERCDVSWISTEAVDRAHEVVLAGGMDDGQFAQNPIVTLGHAYQIPPVGKSLWRQRARAGGTLGIKAKTVYPVRPDDWPISETWMPDKVFALVQAGLVSGKSIGFLPLKVRAASSAEVQQNAWPSDVLVIENWLLLEYACCWLPENQEAIVQEVSKSVGSLGRPWTSRAPAPVAFTAEKEIVKVVHRVLEDFDPAAFVTAAIERARGRV